MATVIEKIANRRGNPGYSDEDKSRICEDILSLVASGNSVKSVLDREGMPSVTTFWNWVNCNAELRNALTQAREFGVEAQLDEAIDIADNANADIRMVANKAGDYEPKIDGEAIARSRLRVETRLKYAAMIAPKRYGDKLDVTSGGEPLPAPSAVTIDARVQTLVMLAQSRQAQEEEARRLLEDD